MCAIKVTEPKLSRSKMLQPVELVAITAVLHNKGVCLRPR